MKRVVFAVLLLGCALFAYHKYEQRQAMQLIERSVRDSSVRVGTMLGYMRGGKGVSYGEFIQRADEEIRVIANAQVSLRVAATKASPEVLTSAVDYLGKSETVLRAAKALTQSIIAAKVARARVSDAIRTMETFIGDPGDDVARYRAKYLDSNGIVSEVKKADQEFDSAAAIFQAKLQDLSNSAKSPARGIDKSAYLSESDFEKITITIK